MSLIVRQVGEQSLIDVEDPRVLTIAAELHGLTERQRVIRNDPRVGRVPVADHVLLDEFDAPGRNAGPAPGVIGLNGKSPAVAVEVVVCPEFSAVGDVFVRRDLEDGLGQGGGDCDKDDEEEEEAGGGH